MGKATVGEAQAVKPANSIQARVSIKVRRDTVGSSPKKMMTRKMHVTKVTDLDENTLKGVEINRVGFVKKLGVESVADAVNVGNVRGRFGLFDFTAQVFDVDAHDFGRTPLFRVALVHGTGKFLDCADCAGALH